MQRQRLMRQPRRARRPLKIQQIRPRKPQRVLRMPPRRSPPRRKPSLRRRRPSLRRRRRSPLPSELKQLLMTFLVEVVDNTTIKRSK